MVEMIFKMNYYHYAISMKYEKNTKYINVAIYKVIYAYIKIILHSENTASSSFSFKRLIISSMDLFL